MLRIADNPEALNIVKYADKYNLNSNDYYNLKETQSILDAVEGLNIDNPFECMLYNQMMSALDEQY